MYAYMVVVELCPHTYAFTGIVGYGFRVSYLGFRVWGLGFGVWGLGFRIKGFGFRV